MIVGNVRNCILEYGICLKGCFCFLSNGWDFWGGVEGGLY